MIELRKAQFADHTAIAALHADSWKKTYRGIFSDEFLEHEVEGDRLHVWEQRFTNPSSNQMVTVAILDNAIVGFCCVFLDDSPEFGSLLDNLHVSSGFQKLGIGKMLMQNAARHICESAQSRRMYLWVYERNTNALHAYLHLGGTKFEVCDKKNHDGSVSKSCRVVWDDASKLA